MRWTVTIEGSRRDIERLVATDPRIAAGADRREAVIAFTDDDDNATDATRETIRREIETTLRHINASGKLRWGRSFEGVRLNGGVRYESASGDSGQVVFVGAAHAHLTPQEFGDVVEKLGQPRPPLPFGYADVEALDIAQVMDLADGDPIVARVLRLVDLMLEGDDDKRTRSAPPQYPAAQWAAWLCNPDATLFRQSPRGDQRQPGGRG